LDALSGKTSLNLLVFLGYGLRLCLRGVHAHRNPTTDFARHCDGNLEK
jgi:hypothetical protein